MEDRIQKRYESVLAAVGELERQLASARNQILILEAEKKQWLTEKVMQQQIIQQALDRSNATSNSYLEENRALKNEIKRMQMMISDFQET